MLFLVFNRPDTTRQVFDVIRAAKPPRFYVVADGPRLNNIGDTDRCEQVRKIVTEVDWSCEFKTLFRNENKGCKYGVSEGINWFFENEEEGIIIEDDVLPLLSFFQYCDELLERYRNNTDIASISGSNFISKNFKPKESYFFSKYTHIWGWATWRRVWQNYDVNMKAWPEWFDKGGLALLSEGNESFENYWKCIFNNEYGVSTWDYQWLFTCWFYGMSSIIPVNNLTHNLGFMHEEAVHTKHDKPKYIKESIPVALTFPLLHPINIKLSLKAEKLMNRNFFGSSKKSDLLRSLNKIPLFKFLINTAFRGI